MKKLFLILTSVLMVCQNSQAFNLDSTSGNKNAFDASKNPKERWNDANTAYINANYIDAIKGYESILAQGLENENLYFNLGNAYFKRGMNGKAILNYNKALKLDPSDEDVLYNLSIANTKVQDKIDVMPVFFMKRWAENIRCSVSLFFFALTLLGAGAYLLMRHVGFQKIGFFGGLISCILFIVSVLFASIARREVIHPKDAVVMSNAATVKSSPDKNSKDIFVLHEGTKVGVKSMLGEWREIVLSDGNKGWIAHTAIEMID